MTGKVDIIDDGPNTTITLDGSSGTISAGGNGQNSILSLHDASPDVFPRILLNANNGTFIMTRVVPGHSGSYTVIGLHADTGDVGIGGNGQDGDLALFPAALTTSEPVSNKAQATIRLAASDAYAALGGNGVFGRIGLFPTTATNNGNGNQATIFLNAGAGDIVLNDPTGSNRIHLVASDAYAALGGNGVFGRIGLFPTTATNNGNGNQATIFLNAGAGDIVLNDPTGSNRIHLVASDAYAALGGNGVFGRIGLFPTTATNNGNGNQATIFLNGGTGDIVLSNADCAEDFDIVESEGLDPGTVMAIDEDGMLRPSQDAYDRKVAGVISGAGGYKPGIVLDKQQSKHNRMPVALVGKVFCKVDARYSPVGVGDLLTTSPTLGHAMKAIDPLKAFGAVIGKALRSLKGGKDLIPILIALQ